jgi:CHAT domain-containing protein
MLKRVMGLASATGLTRIRIQAHLMAAEVAETVGVSQQAQQELTQAITLIAEHESDVRDETHRASWFSDKLIPFHRLVRLLNAQGDITSALEIAQQAKARELRRSLESEADSVSRQLQAISPALAHQIAQLRDELGLHQRQMRLSRWRAEISDDPDAAMSEVALKANAARVAEEWLRMAVAQAHQQLPSRARRVLGWRAADLAKTLAPNERLIEYLWGEDCIWAWAVTQDGIQDHCLISNITQVKLWCGGYEQAIRRALSQWASPMAQRLAPKLLQDIQDIGQALYKTLIGQFGASALAEGRGPHDTWIIAADGPLNHIPFHALPQPNGAPLLHAVDVRYVPGAALMQPPIPHQPIRAVGIAGAAEHAEHARRELDAAQTCFGNLQRWEGEAVDGLHLHEVLSGRNWVHLATHAAVHPRNPMLSSFALGGRDVTLAEVMELDLKRACVVLSACETGLGLHKGSDVFSLARGFMRAGATTLITSQWRVTSEITAELMRTFYAQVAQRQTVTQALRAAQLAMRAQGDHPLHAHPAYWAPMTVFGADRIPIDLSAS